jgi:hypothetical protein
MSGTNARLKGSKNSDSIPGTRGLGPRLAAPGTSAGRGTALLHHAGSPPQLSLTTRPSESERKHGVQDG